MEGTGQTGGCNCGGVRYKIDGAPLMVAACHCTQCRRQSGAAYSINVIVKLKNMTVEGGLTSWADADTESGAPVTREFCATCGSPIRSLPAASPGIAAVKAGTIDDPAQFAPAMHIWTASKLPWVTVPEGLPQYERGPQV